MLFMGGQWLVLSLLRGHWHCIQSLQLKDVPRTKKQPLQHSAGPHWPAQLSSVTQHHQRTANTSASRNPLLSTCLKSHVPQCGPMQHQPALPTRRGCWHSASRSWGMHLCQTSASGLGGSFLKVWDCLGQELRLQPSKTPADWLFQMASHHLLCLQSLIQTGTLEREVTLERLTFREKLTEVQVGMTANIIKIFMLFK